MGRRRFRRLWSTCCLCCGLLPGLAAGGQARIVLAGSGSTVAAPVFGAWTEAFNRKHEGNQVAFIPTSSGDGVRQIMLSLGDFAVGEIPLTDGQMNDQKVKLKQAPIGLIAVAPIYNVPGARQLSFTGELLALMYCGKVTSWDDRRVALLNPDISLPHLPIVTVQRPESSGTRHVFAAFLLQSSPEFRSWTATPHREVSGQILALSSRAMVEKVALTPGTIGFVETGLAERSGLALGKVRNRRGKFVAASGASVEAACRASERLHPDQSVEVLADGEEDAAYPLTAFAWVYWPATGLAPERRLALDEFLSWCLQEGGGFIIGHDYFPLSRGQASHSLRTVQAALQ